TPNRGDCLGGYGIARDLAATGIGVLKPIDKPFVKETENSPLKVEIETEYCGEFAVRYIKNVKNCESPFWIKKRLIAVGFTPKNALVDITNYIMWEFNRPLHCYDYKKTGNDFLIRGATDGEKYIALNGKEYVLPKDATLICANDKILGAGGIIGGVDSMTEMDTKEIVVECAFFDPMNIAATARKIGVNTDAKYRFERCVDYADTDFILDYAAKLIMEICGGEIANSIRDTKKTREQKNIKFLHSDILRILGMDISADEIKAILKQLGYVLTLNEDEYEVIVPSWRPYIEIKENVIEDIIRIYGYDRLISIPINDEEIDEDGVNKINRERSNKFYEINKLLASNGLTEVISWSFIKEKMASEFAVLNDDLKLLNPISQDMTYMRPSLLPGMIDIIKYNNARSINNVAIFENGIVFDGSKTNEQKKVLAGLRSGLAMEKNIYGTSRQYDIYDVKKDLFDVLLLYGINAENLILKKEVPNYYNSARSGSVVMGNTVIGVFGEIHPSIIAKFEIKNSVNAFELYLDSIPRNKDKTTQKKRIVLNNLLPIYRDFAFIIDKNLEIGGIIDIVKKINKDLIKEINLFDIYSGKGIEENKKSVAFSIKIQPIDKNLTIEEIDAICDKVISEITQKVGGILRDK
ncbi:MAG: phenylalanine--tRNA ligase subunit beta, partial [Rickettsiales bacterium]|nr:phenylalanine--tRNA ligase subunit beta [Rickettsiales bacterium]